MASDRSSDSTGMTDSGEELDDGVVVVHPDDVSNYNPEQILPLQPAVVEKIRVWLGPTDYNVAGGEYRRHLASHVVGTGTWLTATPTYQQWLHSAEHGLLWIKGIPGSGKSVMAATLADELARANPGSPVLYFFFRQIIDANHRPEALLRDWTHQLLQYSPPLQKKLAAQMEIERSRSIDSLSIDDMWNDLRMAFANLPGKVFCIADALDEMDSGHDTFLQALGALGQWRPQTVKVLITSRPVPTVELPLRTIPCLQLRLDEQHVDADIATYVNFTLAKSEIPKAHWPIIRDAVPGRANGLFLYAKLAMDAFLEPGADVDAVLSALPQDLNELYTGLLEEHARRSAVPPAIQHLILESITHAMRPLRLLELAEMIRVCAPDRVQRDIKATKDIIRSACGPLLQILVDETVSVVHHSFTEYLRGSTRQAGDPGYPILDQESTHANLALVCLSYLKSGSLLDGIDADGSCDSGDDASEIGDSGGHEPGPPLEHRYDPRSVGLPPRNLRYNKRIAWPFFSYAVSGWYRHILSSEAVGWKHRDQLDAGVDSLLGKRRLFEAWVLQEWPLTINDEEMSIPHALHVSAYLGLGSYTEKLAKKTDVDLRYENGPTPIWWAARDGSLNCIRALLSAGANPNIRISHNGETPLFEATMKRHHEAISILLEAGADPHVSLHGDNDRTPLIFACECGHLESVEVFLKFVEDIDKIQRGVIGAARCGRANVVRRLLEHPGVDVNKKAAGETPLFAACRSRQADTVKVILQAGADAKVTCVGAHRSLATQLLPANHPYQIKQPGHHRIGMELTCLHILCAAHAYDGGGIPESLEEDAAKIFHLLVEAGVDPNQPTLPSKATALHAAAIHSPLLTRLLLLAGADANAVDCRRLTPLCHTRRMDCVALLVEIGGADVNARDNKGRTRLFSAVNWNDEEMFCKLLGYGISCNAQDTKGNTALHQPLSHMSMAVITHLLQAGADPNLQNHVGLTPLMISAQTTTHVERLLAAGADIEAVDKSGASVLFRLFHGYFDKDASTFSEIRLLLDRGASPTRRDYKGRTILHNAVKGYKPRIPVHTATWQPSTDGGVTKKKEPQTRFDVALSIGLDPFAVDYHGNGLLHELASHSFRMEYRRHLSAGSVALSWRCLGDLGLDMDARNHAGRTPLHLLCAASVWMEDDSAANFIDLPFDCVLSKTSNIDTRDKYGATPLHLAAVYSPQLTLKLLRAGADPTVATFEGLTPLHLAARSRQSNIVGMLLDDLRRRQNACKGPDGAQEPLHDGTAAEKPREPVPGVDAIAVSDEKIITPLYYACRSGRPETVSLLLEAGADISLTNVFEACAGFEREAALWPPRTPEKKGGYAFCTFCQIHHLPGNCRDSEDVHATAVRIDDTMRPARRENAQPGVLRPHETARLDEILDMLLARGAAFHGYTVARVDPPIWPSYLYSIQDSEYMVRSMSVAWRKWEEENGVANDVSSTARSVHERATPLLDQAWMQSLKEHESAITRDSENRDLFHRFMVQRQYHLVEAMARVGSSFLPTAAGPWSKCNFSSLVSGGFTSLVDKVGTLELERKLPEGLWHAYGDETKPGLWRFRRDFRPETPSTHHSLPESPGSHNSNLGEEDLGVDDLGQTHARREFWPHRPYLIAAVSRELPNMGVVRLLVEKFGVHIDETHSEYSFKPPGWRYEEEIHFALRTAASGANWWQVHQALPYLIQAGADVNLMPLRGDSPLCWAIADRMRVPRPFALAASRMLIAAGADVNAHNYGGFSCLATASISNNGELVEFFLAQGAVVTGDAVEGALRNRNPHILEPLLSAGPFDFASGLRPRFGQAYKAFPCFRDSEVDWRCKDMEEGHYPVIYLASVMMSKREEGWPLSLDEYEKAGRNIKMLLDHGETLSYTLYKLPDEELDSFDHDQNRDLETPPKSPDEYPLLHHMLYERLAADALLEMADLKVNERDPEGRTMLHAACYSDRGLGRLLRINKESAAGDVQEVTTVFDRLITLGGDVKAKDDNGLNILHHTVQKDQYYWGYHSDDSSEMKRDKFAQTINIILERQPDLANDADNRGFTPLLLAAELPVLDERVRAIRILLSHGADPQRTANSGDTILHLLASKHEFSEPSLGCLFQELVNTWGVDVNARNACGWTPLSVYCSQPGAPGANDPSRVKRKEEEALRLMVELGADLSVRDNSGRGLLHLAARGGPFRFKKLMDLGLDPSLEDDAQQTPIDRAAACGQTAILELFERKD